MVPGGGAKVVDAIEPTVPAQRGVPQIRELRNRAAGRASLGAVVAVEEILVQGVLEEEDRVGRAGGGQRNRHRLRLC